MTDRPSYAQRLELRTRRSPFVRKDELKNDSARMLVMACAAAYLVFRLAVALLSGDGLEFTASIVGGLIVLAAIFFGARRMRLRVSPDSIVRVGGLPARRVPRADVIGVVRVPVENFRMQEGHVDVLVDREGRCLLRLRDRMWENGDLDRAWAHAGLGIQYAQHAMNYKQLEAWIPGSTKLWERRPIAVGNAIFVLLLIAIVALVLFIPAAP